MRNKERNFPVLVQLVSTECENHSCEYTWLTSLALEKIPETTSLQTMRGEQVNLSQSSELKKSFCSRKP